MRSGAAHDGGYEYVDTAYEEDPQTAAFSIVSKHYVGGTWEILLVGLAEAHEYSVTLSIEAVQPA
jgi:hypothetical protein